MTLPPSRDPDEVIPTPGEGYDLPPELPDEPLEEGPPPGQPGGRAALRTAIALGVVVLVAGALLGYRGYHRNRVVAEGVGRAEALLRLDTAAGYRDAAAALEPLAEMDRVGAASVRAFALAMLFADYRDASAEEAAETLLVEPGRARAVPAHANLAYAALALGRREAGNATTAAARAGDVPWAHALQARVALLAGNMGAATDPAAAAAAAELPAGLAVQGDILRRTRRDLAGARAAYEAALAASPRHARAAFGLAKLALSGPGDPAPARAALERLLEDKNGTPGAERGRAALHLAALALRANDPGAASQALERAGLGGPARAWAERAAQAEARSTGPYRAVQEAPTPLQSASDDDPADLPPFVAPPPAPPPPAKPTVAQKSTKRATPKKATAKASGAKGAKKTAKKTTAKTGKTSTTKSTH